MKTRTIELTLDKAKEWYNKGGELKEIALQAYKEDELKSLTYEEICKGLFTNETLHCIGLEGVIEELDNCEDGFNYMTVTSNAATSCHQLEKLLAINKLVNVAKYFNGSWEPDWSNTNQCKYYIKFDNYTKKFIVDASACIQSSDVWFKSRKLALKAVEILGEETIKLAIASNW